ncbi:chemotaxis protein CheD [Miltoncostaea marina]|uniref:chemotaxis protein CheD n=1 Tax=Miltoncostaea marina TaxID=2843215 RepID=UPI001C3D65D1|nr:chemotaxis protein CheD [Miltoncostaea marina]
MADRPNVGMGQMAASAQPGAVISALGLGSCVGVVLADPRAGVAGMAHVMLPAAPPGPIERPGRYADTAVPALVEQVVGLGARRGRLDVVIAGGAQMFGDGSGPGVMRIGERNVEAVRAALALERLAPRAAEVGGAIGRTLRVEVASGAVSVRAAGGREVAL